MKNDSNIDFNIINIRQFKDTENIQVVLHINNQLYSTNLKQLVEQIIKESGNG